MSYARTFTPYTVKVLKQLSYLSITKEANLLLSQILFQIVHIVVDQTEQLLNVSQRKTLNVKTLGNTFRILFTGTLLENMMKGRDKHIFPLSFIKGIIKRHTTRPISSKYVLLLTSALEYLSAELLDIACFHAYSREPEVHFKAIQWRLPGSGTKMDSLDLYYAIQSDSELNTFFNSHLRLVISTYPSEKGGSNFINLVREVCKEHVHRISKDALILLHKYITS